MASTPRQYDLVLLGATGYTGKFAAEWINNKLPPDLKWAIAGRNAKKLQSIAGELSSAQPNRTKPAIETVELEKSQLTTLAQKTRVIITTVGPYMFYGEPVLSACVESGTHYLDCTGEIPWYYDMITKYHEQAQKNGTIIIPQCGLDSVPADITSFFVARHIRKTLNAATRSVTFSMYSAKTGISGGTSSTILNLFSNYSLSHLEKSLRPYSISPIGAPEKPAKHPSGSLLYRLFGMDYIKELGGAQTAWLMATVDRCIVHRSWGLYSAIAKDTSESSVSYGPTFNFKEFMRARSPVLGVVMAFGLAFGGFLLAFPPTRWILSPILKNFVIQQPGQGPSEEKRKKDFMIYKALGVADTEKGERVVVSLKAGHGAYELTGMTLAAAAGVILREDLAGTGAGKLGGGILTPAMLGDPYVEKLREFGMKIDVEA